MEKVTLESGEVISREFYEKLMSVTGKRAKRVIAKIMKDGGCTTEEIEAMGYEHAPRAPRDVKDAGIPIVKTMVKSEKTGKRMARYTFGDWEAQKKQNSLAKTKGRTILSDKLKQKLIEENGSKCALYGEIFPENLLQTDHRVPFEIGGDPEDMMDTSKFMLLSPSANRAKSHACENCSNWNEKNVEMCITCYYASPENYSHVAGVEERRLDIAFRTSDIAIYDRIVKEARDNNYSVQEAFKRIVSEAQSKDKTTD